MKQNAANVRARFISRAPRGARGLKLQRTCYPPPRSLSRPARGAWIETAVAHGVLRRRRVAPRAGRVD